MLVIVGILISDRDQAGANDPRWRIYRQPANSIDRRHVPTPRADQAPSRPSAAARAAAEEAQAPLDLAPKPKRRRKRKTTSEPATGTPTEGVPFDDPIPDLA